MRKLVLGIIALISVQFAFVTYMMVLQSPLELTNETSEPIPRSTRLVPIDHFTSSGEVTPQPEVATSKLEPRHFRPDRVAEHIVAERAVKRGRRFVSYGSKPAFSLASSRSAEPVEFESVVISYNRSSKNFDCASQDTPKTNTRETPTTKAKKRSYLAKASPVIKRPWEWIKTVASKLN